LVFVYKKYDNPTSNIIAARLFALHCQEAIANLHNLIFVSLLYKYCWWRMMT